TWSSWGIVVERALDNPPPLSRWLLGALALTGWSVFAPETGAPAKGAGVGCRRSTRPGCEGAFPGRDEHQLVRGPSGLAPPRSTIRLRWLLLLPGFGVGFGVALAHGLGAFFHDQVGDQGDAQWQQVIERAIGHTGGDHPPLGVLAERGAA